MTALSCIEDKRPFAHWSTGSSRELAGYPSPKYNLLIKSGRRHYVTVQDPLAALLPTGIYVKCRRAGERVIANLRGFIAGRLKLLVNVAMSAVDVPQKCKFLGFSFTAGRSPNRRKIAT